MLADGEKTLHRDQNRLDDERKTMDAAIGKQVAEQAERARVRLERETGERLARDRRALFAITVGVCAFASLAFLTAMAGRWRTLIATLPDWAHTRLEQAQSIGRWATATAMWFDRTVPQGWWHMPLLILIGVLTLAIVAAIGLLAYAMVRVAIDAYQTHRSWNTLPVHAVFWTFLAAGSLMLAAGSLMLAAVTSQLVGGRVHWLTLWPILAAIAFTAYHLAASSKVDDFIRSNR